MPRPAKERRVCFLPKSIKFKPIEEFCGFCEKRADCLKRKRIQDENNIKEKESISLSLDEYEVIRLIDYKGLNQEEAALVMGVARTTVQAIYSESRKKLSQMLIEAKPLEIKGGNYKISFGEEFHKEQNCRSFNSKLTNSKGTVNKMEILIPVNQNVKETAVAAALGRANYFLVYNVEKDSYNFIENTVKNNASGTGIQAAQILVDTGARVLLTPRCGMKAGKVLDAAGFKIYKTVSDNLAENIEKYKNNELTILAERSMGHHGGR